VVGAALGLVVVGATVAPGDRGNEVSGTTVACGVVGTAVACGVVGTAVVMVVVLAAPLVVVVVEWRLLAGCFLAGTFWAEPTVLALCAGLGEWTAVTGVSDG
jgi:hypothetical protein